MTTLIEDEFFKRVHERLIGSFGAYTTDQDDRYFIQSLKESTEWKQILQALQENPKLKAEIETRKILENRLREDGLKMMQENESLRQLKKRTEDRLKKEESKDMSPECMGCEICYLKTELQQLLKGDTT